MVAGSTGGLVVADYITVFKNVDFCASLALEELGH
jgi:hypothetical protein